MLKIVAATPCASAIIPSTGENAPPNETAIPTVTPDARPIRFGKNSWPSTTNAACEATNVKPVAIRSGIANRKLPPCVAATAVKTYN